jgi:hypothetical protein
MSERLPDVVLKKTIRFHLDKASQLEKELNSVKSSGEKKILDQENKLKQRCEAIQKQIADHKLTATALSNQLQSLD